MKFQKLKANNFFLDLQELAEDLCIFFASLFFLNMWFNQLIAILIFIVIVAIKKIISFYVELLSFKGGFIEREDLKYYYKCNSIYACIQVLIFIIVELVIIR